MEIFLRIVGNLEITFYTDFLFLTQVELLKKAENRSNIYWFPVLVQILANCVLWFHTALHNWSRHQEKHWKFDMALTLRNCKT